MTVHGGQQTMASHSAAVRSQPPRILTGGPLNQMPYQSMAEAKARLLGNNQPGNQQRINPPTDLSKRKSYPAGGHPTHHHHHRRNDRRSPSRGHGRWSRGRSRGQSRGRSLGPRPVNRRSATRSPQRQGREVTDREKSQAREVPASDQPVNRQETTPANVRSGEARTNAQQPRESAGQAQAQNSTGGPKLIELRTNHVSGPRPSSPEIKRERSRSRTPFVSSRFEPIPVSGPAISAPSPRVQTLALRGGSGDHAQTPSRAGPRPEPRPVPQPLAVWPGRQGHGAQVVGPRAHANPTTVAEVADKVYAICRNMADELRGENRELKRQCGQIMEKLNSQSEMVSVLYSDSTT